MKTLTNITISCLFVICLFIQTSAQNDISPYVVNPLIGDTLSLDERNFYQLFLQIEGFQSAVFYLNPDSTLNADVKYSDNGIIKDTLFKNYKSLKSLNYHIYARDALEIGMPERVLNYQISVNSKGAEVSTYMNDGQEISGELLSVRKNSILLLNPECDDRLLNADCINHVNAFEIDKLIIKGNSNVVLGVSLGLLASVVVGAIIYQSNYENSSSWLRGLAAYEKSKAPIILSSIGLITLGATIGFFTSTPDEVINIYSENDIRGLSSYSRYPKEEPNELIKLK